MPILKVFNAEQNMEYQIPVTEDQLVRANAGK